MRRSFDLTFSTKRGDFRISVAIEKSHTERMSFKTGYNGQPVKWIKVAPKDPNVARITSRKQIAHVCQASELQSLYPTGNEDSDGNPEYVVIDKTNLKNMFPSRAEMRVLRTVPASCVPLHYMTGTHYFLNVRMTKKNKKRTANPDDVAMYDMIHTGLLTNNEILVVQYTAMNTNKYAVIYPDHCGLRMSNLIASDYQKHRKEKQKLNQQAGKNKLYNRLVKGSRRKRMNVGDIQDDYGQKLEELVEAVINGQVIESKIEPKVAAFSRLAALEEDTESDDSDVQQHTKKHRRSKHRSRSKKKKTKKNPDSSESDSSDSD